MFLVALTPVGAQQTFAVTGSAQTSEQLGFDPQGNPNQEIFLVQPLNGDITVTLDGATAPVAGSVGFLIAEGTFTTLTRGEMVNAKWIAGGSVSVNVQGALKPPFPQVL